MKKFLLCFAVVASLISCSGNDKKTTDPAGATTSGERSSGDLYFDYTVDGKPMQIAAADISASYYVTGDKKVFKIFAGKEGEPNVLLVIPHDMTQPSSTPNGSKDYDQQITQGSVSLQNYPEKNYTTNSFNTTYDEMSVVIPDAVVIISSEKEADKARIITGTFNATTYGEKDSKDPKNTNHKVSGKFRIRHEFSSTNGGEF
ncbi:hypothetical protein [Ferruginibacter sp. HRS2-29]|uniref:hypothetical protein n=1 Tax=Ferruginibacter sp. HRS2-29 TaxID=2487334 RepID=UPI0020CD6092|nr:hypothetical protein [Ferruginibacter sp. HRS2-29]MCP9752774.1 hypothetical protein [Ferruginibacter sp. HRS2-29]